MWWMARGTATKAPRAITMSCRKSVYTTAIIPPTTVYAIRMIVNRIIPSRVGMPNTMLAMSPPATICAWM